MTDLHEILYCSVLAPDQPPTVVARIIAQARTRNAERGITGLLVFDGQRFCQHFEGPRQEALELLSRLEEDSRHTCMRVVYDGALAQRRYQRFEMGLAQIEVDDPIAELGQLDGAAALERFLALTPGFDISG